ncbi:MAG: OmpA family protein [Gammaproteobacteria bacterium]|nr:OmpA family protein [Gammaproteobacteria bacterium]
MNISVKLSALVLAVSLLAGCAGPNQRVNNTNMFCAIAGGLAGGVLAGAVTNGDDDNDNGAALGGAVAGAMLALLVCPNEDDTVAAEPMVETAVCAEVPPAGALLDAQGCAFDSDNDGVVDGVDMCADTPEGVKVDRVGCPLDSDKDGVEDYQDMCPATPLGTIVDTDGCPLPGTKLLSLTGVNFATDKSVLTTDAKEILEEAVTLLKETDAVIEVRVEGHTDSRGSEAYNMTLSQSRAESVVAYLVSRGVKSNSLVPVGMGESSPVANNDTTAGQAANRRVDFVVNR